jgi:FSR family fosmidomycin resistance protein-like MFS transporter
MFVLLKDKYFSAAALSHFMVDVLNGPRAILFTYICVTLGYSNAVLGLATTLFQVVASFSQPFYGYLADRIGPRWLIGIGLLWMVGFFSVAMLMQGWVTLLFLIIGSMGSGAFHPAGAMQATMSGRQRLAGEEATAASFFFSFGQIGFLVGPVVGGALLDRFGLRGILFMTMAALPAAIFSIVSYRSLDYTPPLKRQPGEKRFALNPNFSKAAILSLLIVAACQAWAQQNISTFMPKYLSDMGQPASIYGLVSALFAGAAALGNIAGGSLADRLGEKKIIMTSMLLATAPFLLVPVVGYSLWLYLLVMLAGGLNGAAYSVIVVMAQRLIPGGMGLASGLVLGFIFSAGALGVLVSGFIADMVGVQFVLYLSTGTALVGGLAAYWLHAGKTRKAVL